MGKPTMVPPRDLDAERCLRGSVRGSLPRDLSCGVLGDLSHVAISQRSARETGTTACHGGERHSCLVCSSSLGNHSAEICRKPAR